MSSRNSASESSSPSDQKKNISERKTKMNRELKSLTSSLKTNTTISARDKRTADRNVRMEENKQKRKYDMTKRNAKSAMTRTVREFLAKKTTTLTMEEKDPRVIIRVLGILEPELKRGAFFVIESAGTFYTLTYQNMIDVLSQLERILLDDEFVRDNLGGEATTNTNGKIEKTGSDEAAAEAMARNKFIITRWVKPDTYQKSKNKKPKRTYKTAKAAYFDHLHDFEDEDLTRELHKLGCFKKIEATNYVNNCLWLAFKQAGVEKSILESMKRQFLRRTISRKNIAEIAKQNDLYVEIRSGEHGDNTIRYGDKKNKLVSIGIFNNHYIHMYETKYTAYSIKNYDELKSKENWWKYYSATENSESRGMNSLNLLKAIMKTNHVKEIDICTEGVFATQFHSNHKSTEFTSLDYAEKYTRLFHPERLVKGKDFQKEHEAVMREKQIEGLMKLISKNPTEAERLKTKIKKLRLGKKAAIKLLNKHIPVEANIFFDFETSTRQTHTAESTIIECRKQILRADKNPQEVITRIEQKIKDKNLSTAQQAHEWQAACPHVAYLCAYSEFENDTIDVCRGETCAKDMLNNLAETYGTEKYEDDSEIPTIRLLAHNLTYDISFIINHLHRCELVERGTSVVCGSAFYTLKGETRGKGLKNKTVRFKFQDTLKTISMPLGAFGDAFKLKQAKEVMCYDMYTQEFVNKGGIATKDQIQDLKFKDKEALIKNLNDWGCVVEGGYDMIKYSEIYCRADVHVLKEGWRVFRDYLLKSELSVDTFAYPTISSLGDAVLTEAACYDGVNEISGIPRAFIALCSVGGRVMCAQNKKISLTENNNEEQKVADMDAVSLYPSAMSEGPGFLKGSPKVWNKDVDLKKTDGYFLKIRVKKVGKTYDFPITCVRTEEGGNHWTNELQDKEIFVDKNTLSMLINHQKIEYEIIQGYYFDEGRNKAIKAFIRTLFNMRLKLKSEGNPLQIAIKLLMNSCYGICGLKPVETDVAYRSYGEDSDDFLSRHFNEIKSFTQLGNHDHRFEVYKEIDSHFNRQHVACEVLSYSKVIMNRVMCLAQDNNIKIYYTDTDSMHIEHKYVKGGNDSVLAKLFKKKYNRDLDGKGLGQFHTDFEFGGSFSNIDGELVPCTLKSKGEITAVKSIFLGKKAYIDEIQDEAGQKAYHIRLKGISPSSIKDLVTTKYTGDPMACFKNLFEGNPEYFELGKEGVGCMFRVNKNHSMSTITMTRKIKF